MTVFTSSSSHLDGNTVYAWRSSDRETSRVMQGYFANFITTGDPNGEGLPDWSAVCQAHGGLLRQTMDAHAPYAGGTAGGKATVPAKPFRQPGAIALKRIGEGLSREVVLMNACTGCRAAYPCVCGCHPPYRRAASDSVAASVNTGDADVAGVVAAVSAPPETPAQVVGTGGNIARQAFMSKLLHSFGATLAYMADVTTQVGHAGVNGLVRSSSRLRDRPSWHHRPPAARCLPFWSISTC